MKHKDVFADLNQVGATGTMNQSNSRCTATWTTCCWDWQSVAARRRHAR